MEKTHPYEEPAVPLPLCAFKFDAPKFSVVRDAYEANRDAVEYFGAFAFDRPDAKHIASSPDNFEKVLLFLFKVYYVFFNHNATDSTKIESD